MQSWLQLLCDLRTLWGEPETMAAFTARLQLTEHVVCSGNSVVGVGRKDQSCSPACWQVLRCSPHLCVARCAEYLLQTY